MTDYKLKKILNENTVILSSTYGHQLWSKCTLRKNSICEQTRINIPKGSKAFRPDANSYNRTHRISQIGMYNILALVNKRQA